MHEFGRLFEAGQGRCTTSRRGPRLFANQRAHETSPIRASARIGSALLVAGVAEVHQLPDRVGPVGLDQLTASIQGDLDCTDESQVGTVEARQLGSDAFEAP